MAQQLFSRLALAVLAATLVLTGGLVASPRVSAAEQCFRETGFCIEGRFQEYWQANGGLARNGYPLSTPRSEVLEDGKEYLVQYFERVRLEYHPENPAPYDVLLGQFGRRAIRTLDRLAEEEVTRPREAASGATFFAETGHNVNARFSEYWRANGGLSQFGYPITEEMNIRLEGQDLNVQYFERARFEYHPEHAGTPYEVLLGQFGRAILADADLLAGERGFNLNYITSGEAQRRLGRPVQPAAKGPGGYRGFEHGVMIWRGDTREIFVLCGGDQRAGDDARVFPDTWDEAEPVGGGPGPRAGLYEPGRGFGKLWRQEQEVRDCLGYATDPEETAFTIAVQPFEMLGVGINLMIFATTPEGKFIYQAYRTYIGGSACMSTPALCRPDYLRVPYPGQ